MLVLVMVLGIALPGFAATSNFDAAVQKMVEFKVMEGFPGGELKPEADITRAQFATMIVRALGLEAEAQLLKGQTQFTDVPATHWASGYINLAVSKGIIKGMTATTFAPGANVTYVQALAMILRAMGFEIVEGPVWWLNYAMKGAELGISGFVANPTAAAPRGGVAQLIFNALEVPFVGGGSFKAILDPAPAVPQVVSVTANNLKQITVIFNQVVTKASAEAKANYKINNIALAANDTVALQADGKTVVITRDAVLANGTTYDFEVSGVKTVAGATMAKFEGQFTVVDNSVPEAVAVKVVGPRHLEVTFSEPISNMNAVALLVNNGAIGAINQGVKVGTDNTVLEVEIPTTLTEGTTYTLRVSGAQDYANFTMVPRNLTFTFVKDTTPPVATLKAATQETVTIQFNKPVKGLQKERFYHTFATWTALKIEDAEGNEITSAEIGNYYSEVKVFFSISGNNTSRPLPEGTNTLVILAGPTNAEIQDLWGNKLGQVSIPVSVTADRTAPVVNSVTATAENKVEIVFSKDVLNAGSANAANFEVKDKDGKAITTFTVGYSTANNVFKSTLTFSPKLAAGSYTLTLRNIKDTTLYENALGLQTFAFQITDLTAPGLTSVTKVGSAAPWTLYVMFDEAVATSGANSVLNKANYRINNISTELPGAVVLTMFDNKTVKMTGFTTDPGTQTLYVRNIADVAGNKLGLFDVLSMEIAPVSAPAPTAIKTVDLNKIEITVNQRLSSVTADSLRITSGGGTDTAAAASFVNNANGTATITATLKAARVLTSTADTTVLLEIVGTGVVSILGQPMAAVNYTGGTALPVTDGIAPRVAKIDFHSAGEIRIHFSENIKHQTVSELGLNGFSVVGGTLTRAALVTPGTSGTVIVLTGNDFTANTDVLYNEIAGIADDNNVKLKSFSWTVVLTNP